MAEAEKNADYGKKCAGTGVILKKSKRYYRNGNYYRNRAAFMAHQAKLAEAKKTEQPAQN